MPTRCPYGSACECGGGGGGAAAAADDHDCAVVSRALNVCIYVMCTHFRTYIYIYTYTYTYTYTYNTHVHVHFDMM